MIQKVYLHIIYHIFADAVLHTEASGYPGRMEGGGGGGGGGCWGVGREVTRLCGQHIITYVLLQLLLTYVIIYIVLLILYNIALSHIWPKLNILLCIVYNAFRLRINIH